MRKTKAPPPPTRIQAENFQLEGLTRSLASEDRVVFMLQAIHDRQGQQIELLQQLVGRAFR